MALPRMRLRRLKRFLPRRRLYRKAPSEKTVVALAPKIEQRLLGILKPLNSKGGYSVVGSDGIHADLGNIVRIRNKDLLAESTTQAVLDLGYFKTRFGRIRLVGKMERTPKAFHESIPAALRKDNTLGQPERRFAMKIEGVANFLQRRGLPVPFKKSVRIGKKHLL